VTTGTAVVCKRKKLRLREAIASIQAVAANATAMAEEIEAAMSRSGPDDMLVATEEMVSLRLLADDVEHVVEAILRRERAEGYGPM
jgi:hypothetical protein